MRVQHIDPIELPKNKSSINYQDGENFSDDALQRRISGGYPEKMKWFKISKYFHPAIENFSKNLRLTAYVAVA